ncbi:hypothetical protein ACGVWS_12845 [Enterobacteriaceae bacterium LUAb1]
MKTSVFLLTGALLLSGVNSAYAQDKTGNRIEPNNAATTLSRSGSRDGWGAYVVQQFITPAFNGELNYAECASNPQYKCNGLMVSAFEQDGLYWTASNPPAGKYSMTWLLRSTVNDKAGLYGGDGYMLWPEIPLKNYNGVHTTFVPVYRCIFPRDAGSNNRNDNGCGSLGNRRPDTAPCQSIGVNDAATWMDKYPHSSTFICGFSLNSAIADRDVINTVNTIQQTLNQGPDGVNFADANFNEVILTPWETDAPARIPLIAFFYVEPDSIKYLVTPRYGRERLSPSGNLSYVQQIQSEYYHATGLYAPIVQISGNGWTKAQFDYLAAQQSADIPSTTRFLPQ